MTNNPKEVNPEGILETVFDLVRNFSKFFAFNKETEELKTIEFYILLYIALKGPQNMTTLAKEYAMTKSNITLLVDDMENKGYLSRTRSLEDRRVIIIKLTERGESLFKSFMVDFTSLIQTFIKNVNPADLAIINEGFERITKIIIKNDLTEFEER